MSTHYSANQYENAFAANRLQNYEVPNRYKEHPSPKEGFTRPISNDRGHLLPGVARSSESPWGNFKGTWDDHMDCRRTKHFQKTLTSSQKAFMRNSQQNDKMCEEKPASREQSNREYRPQQSARTPEKIRSPSEASCEAITE
ncbi:protein Flattop homolog [Hydractinia symbiolongicarpus]|uniref:protein Flattop homolog n=1 Tax=Hydractinia symbiolongicarpus TaxID=13093 RepID=UPI0025513ADF|nr:protein Flattop homolog [Hydractinia symbiolongicarpus]